jgi:MarR family transcriptional regulator, transcriptional regulator for hemolysin
MSKSPRKKSIHANKPKGAPRDTHEPLAPEGIYQSLFIIKVLDLAGSIDRAASAYYGTRFGLRIADLRVLVHTARSPGLSLVEISRRARIDRAWISRSVQRLEKRGLVRKCPVDGDDRAHSVFLTDKGDALLRQLIPIIQQRQRQFLQGENHKALEQALDRLARRVEEMMADDEAEWEARVD